MSLKDTPLGHLAVLTGKGAEMARNVFDMAFAKVFPCLIAKAERKGRTRKEVLLVTGWLRDSVNESGTSWCQGQGLWSSGRDD